MVDFHCHPFFKHNICAFDIADLPSYDTNLMPDEVLALLLIGGADILKSREDVDQSLRSQCNIVQLNKGGVKVIVNGFLGVEIGFAQVTLIRILALFDQKPATRYLKAVVDGNLTYADQLQREIRLFQEALDKEFAGGIGLAEGRPGRPILPVENIITVFHSLEGGHQLSHPTLRPAEVLQDLKRRWKSIISLNMTHLTDPGPSVHPLANFCFGMKLGQGERFLPDGNGLTDLGREVIDAAYFVHADGVEREHRVLIDVKHLSLVSRQQFFQYRRDNGYESIPILCSHAGFTGCSLADWARTAWVSGSKQVGGTRCAEISAYPAVASMRQGNATGFNPWTINLYDEEIEEILLSGGLIGLSLDQRILGCDTRMELEQLAPVTELFSEAEMPALLDLANAHLGPNSQMVSFRTAPVDMQALPPVFWIDELIPAAPGLDAQVLQLGLHICHVLYLAARLHDEHPEAPVVSGWRHLVIGSDFDGLINPIDACPNATHYPALQDALKVHFSQIWQAYARARPEVEPYSNVADQAEEGLERLFTTNGMAFLSDFAIWWGA